MLVLADAFPKDPLDIILLVWALRLLGVLR
jgi:hypothetical protein